MRDPISSGDYRKEEDPKLFCSAKTNRGPLDENWRENYTGVRRGNKPVMTAYKLCRVEFKYWGMQNKIERFIHDVGENLSCAFWCYVLLTSLASEMSDWLVTCFPAWVVIPNSFRQECKPRPRLCMHALQHMDYNDPVVHVLKERIPAAGTTGQACTIHEVRV